MSDHISFPIMKSLSQDNLVKHINDREGGLISNKYQRDGIQFIDTIFINDNNADVIGDIAGKWQPIMAAKVLNTETTTLTKLHDKITESKEIKLELEDSIERLGSFYKDIRTRVIQEKSKSKSCRYCGHKHNTESDNYHNLSFLGCLKCEKLDYLFRTADDKKLSSIKQKISKLEQLINDLDQKMQDKAKKTLKSKNWHWFISAGTKSISGNEDRDY